MAQLNHVNNAFLSISVVYIMSGPLKTFNNERLWCSVLFALPQDLDNDMDELFCMTSQLSHIHSIILCLGFSFILATFTCHGRQVI